MRRGSELPSFQQAVPLYEQYQRPDNLVTIVFFWSISCAHCTGGFDIIRDFRERFEQINIITVHMPRSEEDKDLKEIKSTYKKYRLLAPLYVDQDLAISQRFGNRFVPSVYVFDGSGLRFAQSGQQSWLFLKQRVEKILTR